MSKLGLLFGPKFCNEMKGEASECHCGFSLLFSDSAKICLFPLWPALEVSSNALCTSHILEPGLSIFLSLSENRSCHCNGISRKQGYMASSGYTNDFVVIEELQKVEIA